MTAVTKFEPAAEARTMPPRPGEAALPSGGQAALPPSRPRRKALRILLMLLVPAMLLAGGAWYWLSGGRFEETDNANLHIATLAIASEVSGRVVEANVSDNQPVSKGDVLFLVDPEPTRLALSQADAALAGARLNVEQMKAAYRQSLAQEDVSRNDVAFRQTELDRQSTLADRGVATTAVLDEAKHALRAAEDQLITLERATASQLAALGGDADAPTDAHPLVQAALAAKDKAAYNLDLATVRAPADGVVYKADAFRPGQFITAGTPLFSLVETGDIWIDANF